MGETEALKAISVIRSLDHRGWLSPGAMWEDRTNLRLVTGGGKLFKEPEERTLKVSRYKQQLCQEKEAQSALPSLSVLWLGSKTLETAAAGVPGISPQFPS